jgi:hypothetical protein
LIVVEGEGWWKKRKRRRKWWRSLESLKQKFEGEMDARRQEEQQK